MSFSQTVTDPGSRCGGVFVSEEVPPVKSKLPLPSEDTGSLGISKNHPCVLKWDRSSGRRGPGVQERKSIVRHKRISRNRTRFGKKRNEIEEHHRVVFLV